MSISARLMTGTRLYCCGSNLQTASGSCGGIPEPSAYRGAIGFLQRSTSSDVNRAVEVIAAVWIHNGDAGLGRIDLGRLKIQNLQ